MKLNGQVKYILTSLNDAGFQSYVVGGAVRDFLMGKEASDFDFATNAKPNEIKKVFANHKIIDIGEKFGTIRVVLKALVNGKEENNVYEITTYRTEKKYSDSRHPSSVSFVSNLRDDLCRRDFTVNALAYNEKDGVIDITNGKRDIKERVLRTIQAPEKSFCDDALRMLRALRFKSELGFNIEKHAKEAIHSLKGRLLDVSAERINEEFTRLLVGDNVEDVLLDFRDVLVLLMPEFYACLDCSQTHPYHSYDIYTHIIKTVSAACNDPIIRYVMLFHDMGKPYVKTTDKDGIDHFHGHEQKSAILAANILDRLKFTSEQKEHIVKLVRYHDYRFSLNAENVKEALCLLGEEDYFNLMRIHEADILGQNKEKLSRVDTLPQYVELAKQIIKNNECYSLKQLAVKGDDILARGYEKGEQIGAMLNFLLSEVIHNKVENEKNTLLDYLRDAHKSGAGS